MEDLSLHILDIAENSIASGAHLVRIAVREDLHEDRLLLEIADDGKGMREEVAARAADPFYTTRITRRIGMGLALLKAAAEAAEGMMTLESSPESGTTVRATFRLSHIDRKPLGNLAETVTALVASHAGLDILYTHDRDGHRVVLDTREIRQVAGLSSLETIEALSVIRHYLEQEEDALAR